MGHRQVGYRIDAGASDSPVILHVPHSSRRIPPDERRDLVLGEEELAAELAHLTDAHTDVIAGTAAEAAARRPWAMVNLLSRLVVDPERFPDEREVMLRVGMGAVYTRTSHGRPLRRDDVSAARHLVRRWYEPYAEAVTALVDARLAAAGRVTIIDVHSYPSARLPYEIGGVRRPSVCLGTDPSHTPGWLRTAAREAFGPCGDLAENTPFSGCYVPLKHYESDRRVTAVMAEIRRDIYLVEPGGTPTPGMATVIAALTQLIDSISANPVSANSVWANR